RHGGPAAHALEHRQPGAFGLAGIGNDECSPEVAGQIAHAQVAGPYGTQVRGNLGYCTVDVTIPAGGSGQHEGRWLVEISHRCSPAVDELRDVLPGCDLAQERDVWQPVQA